MDTYTRRVVCSELVAAGGLFGFLVTQAPRLSFSGVPHPELLTGFVFLAGLLWRTRLKAHAAKPEIMDKRAVDVAWLLVCGSSTTILFGFRVSGMVTPLEALLAIGALTIGLSTAIGAIEPRDDAVDAATTEDMGDTE